MKSEARWTATWTDELLPEVADEVFERLRPLWQRDDDVDEDVARVQTLAFHLHQRAEGPEERHLGEGLRTFGLEHQLIHGSSVPLCPGQSWR